MCRPGHAVYNVSAHESTRAIIDQNRYLILANREAQRLQLRDQLRGARFRRVGDEADLFVRVGMQVSSDTERSAVPDTATDLDPASGGWPTRLRRTPADRRRGWCR